jgi:hypothetical protein
MTQASCGARKNNVDIKMTRLMMLSNQVRSISVLSNRTTNETGLRTGNRSSKRQRNIEILPTACPYSERDNMKMAPNIYIFMLVLGDG